MNRFPDQLEINLEIAMCHAIEHGVHQSPRYFRVRCGKCSVEALNIVRGLATGLEQATLAPPARLSPAQRLEWIELSTRDDASLSPVSAKTIAQWQQAGFAARSRIVRGPAFWQTTEIEDAPALIAATTAALCND